MNPAMIGVNKKGGHWPPFYSISYRNYFMR